MDLLLAENNAQNLVNGKTSFVPIKTIRKKNDPQQCQKTKSFTFTLLFLVKENLSLNSLNAFLKYTS